MKTDTEGNRPEPVHRLELKPGEHDIAALVAPFGDARVELVLRGPGVFTVPRGQLVPNSVSMRGTSSARQVGSPHEQVEA